MRIHRLIVASAISVVSLGLTAGPRAEAADQAGLCEARIVHAQTAFPKASQDRGEGGTVRVQVQIGTDGKVVKSSVSESSGYPILDRAAQKSVSEEWRFDVSHCVAASVPVTQEVNVVYKRVPKSFSAGVNRRGLEFAKQAAENNQCAVVPVDSGGHVISCIHHATPGGIAASGLATR